MNDQVVAAVVGGVAGLATGALASVVAPWVNWGIERRRLRLQRRQQLVNEWRTGLSEAESVNMFGGGGYYHLPWYQSLRANLRNNGKVRRWLAKHLMRAWYRVSRRKPPAPPPPSSRIVHIYPDGARSAAAEEIATQIERLVKKWRLE